MTLLTKTSLLSGLLASIASFVIALGTRNGLLGATAFGQFCMTVCCYGANLELDQLRAKNGASR